MKQRISYLQALQLHEEQRSKLRSWWQPQEGDYLCIDDHEEMIYYLNGVDKSRSIPLLNIGQSIQLLRELGQLQSVDFDGHAWIINSVYKDPEFCDALWQALLEAL